MKLVLDTNAFNRLLDGRFELTSIQNVCGFVATTVQLGKLGRTANSLRCALLSVFRAVAPEIALPAFVFDTPVQAWKRVSGPLVALTELRAELEALKPKFNNWHDELIATVELENRWSLVTSDSTLAVVAARHGITVHRLAP